jgi:hypothetical protein
MDRAASRHDYSDSGGRGIDRHRDGITEVADKQFNSGPMALLPRMAFGENSSDTSEKSLGASDSRTLTLPIRPRALREANRKFHHYGFLYEALKIDKIVENE